MWKTVLRRTILIIPQVFILSIIVFMLAKLMPGDPFTGLISPEMDPDRIEELRQQYGLNDPWIVQYQRWIAKAIKGDFGISMQYKRPVLSIVADRAINTVFLSFFTLLLTYLIAIPLGIIAGRFSGSKVDHAILLYNFFTYAMPSFIVYLVAILIFGYKLNWFPTSGVVDISSIPGTIGRFFDRIHHIVLPSVCAAILSTTGIVQYLRNEIIDAKSMDYVRTARSKGVPIKMVYRKHIFRNSLLPIAAFFGFTITGLLGGSLFIETVFSYPGMGNLYIEAVTTRDYPIMLTLVLLYGTLSLIGSLLSDIIMTIVDPRIRIE